MSYPLAILLCSFPPVLLTFAGGIELRSVRQPRELRRDLEAAEWDFHGASSRLLIHNIHPYPARFIPQIPQGLIQRFHPGDSSTVFDPFCGSGTTLVEAGVSGIPAVGVDLNPLAVLISRVKTNPLQQAIAPIAREIAFEARAVTLPIPNIPRLDHWFLPNVQQALANVVALIGNIADSAIHDALSVAISRIIVRVSNQESDTRYAAIPKTVSDDDVYDQFVRSAQQIDRAHEEVYGGLFPVLPTCRVIQRDILSATPADIGEVGLVITSPPYPNAYEYWLYHKYRMFWLGMDPLSVKSAEIGARPHYFKKNHQTEKDFAGQMSKTFSLLRQVCRPGAIACFLVGRSVIHGRVIDNEAILRDAATSNAFTTIGSVVRQIPKSRKSFNPANSSINEEHLVLFQREAR